VDTVYLSTFRRLGYSYFLEIYDTHDIINIDLALLVVTLYMSLVQTFLNARKLLGGHAKKFPT